MTSTTTATGKALLKVLSWIGSIALLTLIGLYLTGAFEERIPADHGWVDRVRAAGDGQPYEVRAVAVPVVERAPGTVRAIRDAAVTSRIVAEVREVLVRAGSRVSASDPLVLLDDRDLRAGVSQREEELAAAEARREEAESNFDRVQGAADRNAVSASALEQAAAARLAARADVKRLEQALERARIDLGHATVRAPFDAIVTDRFVHVGDLASPERPLLRVYDPARMRLEAYVRETLAIDLRAGDTVRVQLETLDLRLDGTVEEVVPQADAASRSFLVKVGLPEAEHLYPGMFGRLLLEAGTTERLLVPEAAVSRVGQLTYLTLDDDRASRRLVLLGPSAEDGAVEVQSGVEAGARILVPR